MRFLTLCLGLAACVGGGDDVRIVPDTDQDRVFIGTVSVSPTELSIVGVPGERVVGTVSIANVGEYDLTLRSGSMVEDADQVLVTDEQTNSGRVIGPDRQYDLLVRCELPAADSDVDTDGPAARVQGVLRVQTNDQETPTVDVPVTCAADG